MTEDTTTPHPLTGGSGRNAHPSDILPTLLENMGNSGRKGPLGRSLVSLPKVGLLPCPPSYGRLVSQGWDTIQESWHYHPSKDLERRLQAEKVKAQEARKGGDGVVIVELAGTRLKLHATGAKGGNAFRLETDDLLLMVRSSNCDYGVSVRYLAAGLWEHGYSALRERASAFIEAVFLSSGPEPVRMSRADWAFDFYAPGLTRQFKVPKLRENLVCHSSTKIRTHGSMRTVKDDLGDIIEVASVGTSQRDETITIGNINSLQVTVYDKGQEITDASGKTWMTDLWARENEGVYFEDGGKITDMWRLEVRMGKSYLKSRNCNCYDEFIKWRPQLLADALHRIRLTTFRGLPDRRKRPFHPLWSEAVRSVNAHEALPLGRKVTGRRDAVLDRLARQIAGTARTTMIVDRDAVDKDGLQVLFRRVEEIMRDDPESERKEQAARDRHEFIDEAG